MRLIAKKFIIQSLLDKSFAVAPRSGPTAAFQQVKVEAENGQVSVTGSDGEISLIARTTQVDIEEEGEVLFPSKVHDIIKLCADEDITLWTDEGIIKVESEGAHWEVVCENIEYPDIMEDADDSVQISKELMLQSLNRCRPAIDSDNIRASFAFVQISDGYMRATDGNKFGQMEFPADLELLIPSRALQEIIRLLRGMALEDVGVGQNPRCHIFNFDHDTLIVSKHIVDYPDVKTAMLDPALENDQRLSVNRRQFIDAVKRVGLVADEDTCFLKLDIGDGKLHIASLDKFGNNAYEDLEIHWEGEDRSIGVNHNNLIDVLSSTTGGEIIMTLGEDEGSKLSSLCFLNDEFTGVLMQLRPDLGKAMEGSDRVRAAQIEPVGWGARGQTADAVDEEGGNRARRRARQAEEELPEMEVDAEDVDESILE